MRAAGLAWYKSPRLFEEVPTISYATFVAHAAHNLRSSLALVFALAHHILLISLFKAYCIASRSTLGAVA
jgi:hypothetical protein